MPGFVALTLVVEAILFGTLVLIVAGVLHHVERTRRVR